MRTVSQTSVINVPMYRLEAMNIDKYFRWDDDGQYVGLKDSYLAAFGTTMTALGWETGTIFDKSMHSICDILDWEEELDNGELNNTDKVVETLRGTTPSNAVIDTITEHQLVNMCARPGYIKKEKKKQYARDRRARLAREARAKALAEANAKALADASSKADQASEWEWDLESGLVLFRKLFPKV